MRGLEQTVVALTALRPRLEDATGASVRFAWFVRMDPQTTAQGGRADALLESAPAATQAIQAAGDVVGLHTHAFRWEARHRGWIADHADAAWIEHCLDSSAEAFRRRFGEPSREHRFGDRYSSPAAFERLASLGVQVDLSPEPGQRSRRRPEHVAHATGTIPSYAHAPRWAHRALGGAPWILPLTSADPAPALPAGRRWLRRIRYLGQPRHRTLLLDRAWPSPQTPWDLAEEQVERGVRHLAFAIRSDLILQARWTGASAVLDALVRRPLARRLVFVGGEEAVARSTTV